MHDTQHDVMMRLNVLERRVTALESGATGKESLQVEPTDEDAVIARVRKWVGDQLASTEERVVLAALDRARQERDDARTEATALRVTEENLRAQLAGKDAATVRLHAQLDDFEDVHEQLAQQIEKRDAENNELRAQLAARTDAKPMGWVNVYAEGRGPRTLVWSTEEDAKDAAMPYVIRTVPVFEHPPVAPLVTGTFTDAEIEEAIRTGWANFGLDGNQNALVDEMQSALRPLFDRAARGPVVGACVVRESGNVSATFTYDTNQTVNEGRAVREAEEYGGIAYLLHRGDVIGGEK